MPNFPYYKILRLFSTLYNLTYLIRVFVSRYFLGTCSSTFSFRIHEERDILGFDGKTTHNCICKKGTPDDRCEKPGSWRVKFG